MNTAKEWLKANGHIAEVTRGRISNDNHKRLLAAVESGTKFSDYPRGKGGTVTIAPTGESTYVKPAPPTGEVISELYYRYNLEDFHAVEKSGKIHNMRAACQSCGYSLVGHTCDDPIVLGAKVEVIRRR